MTDYLKYGVPEFKHEERVKTKYIWWSWHPLYPYWSQSCWKFDTQEEAVEFLSADYSGGLEVYHNKLIKHSGEGLHEVLDVPCERLDIWDKCLENKARGFYDKD